MKFGFILTIVAIVWIIRLEKRIKKLEDKIKLLEGGEPPRLDFKN